METDGHYENIHLFQPWWRKVKEAAEGGKRSLYLFGIEAVKRDMEQFFAEGKDRLKFYTKAYEVNPYYYQYDLLLHIFFNFDDIKKREIEIIRETAKKDPKRREALEEYIDRIIREETLGGIKRKEYLFAAMELRWPTTILPNGGLRGVMVRDPWIEKRGDAVCSKFKYILTFGGSGQGKTTFFLAFMLMGFEHYIFTEKGARCLFSTVNKDKLEGVAWPYLQNLLRSSEDGISLYAKRSKICGGWTLKRPHTTDTGGVFKGLLVGNQMKSSSVTDKLTGAHDHPLVMYLIDELQSSPLAPIEASTNFTMRAKKAWVFSAANYDNDDDSCGKNTQPEQGWNNVDENTGMWVSNTTNHQKALVLHFNNDLSPGMNQQGSRLYPHMPTRAFLDTEFPIISTRIPTNRQYRKFWIGFRTTEAEENTVLNNTIVTENRACLDAKFMDVFHKFCSIDTAQGEKDRNVIGYFEEGICAETGKHCWGPVSLDQIAKTSESMKYYEESTDSFIKYIEAHGVKSGDIVIDFTARTAHAELMYQRKYETVKMCYQINIPDGSYRNPYTDKIDPPILIKSNNTYDTYAHQICYNIITLGAYALQQYVIGGRVRGINESLLAKFREGNRGLKEELYLRKFEFKTVQSKGEIYALDSKIDFRHKYKFSTDIFDLLCQAAYYMLTVRKLPLYDDTDSNFVRQDKAKNPESYEKINQIEEHEEIWDYDMIN